MKLEQDIIRASIPLVSGIIAGVYSSSAIHNPNILYPLACALSAAIAALLFLLANRGSRRPSPYSILLFMTGLSCAVTDHLGDIFVPGQSELMLVMKRPADAVRAVIDAIPYPSSSTAGLMKALLTGDRSGLTADTVSAFRDSGAAHILALSGYHLGLIYMLMLRITAPMGNSPAAQRTRSCLIVILCGLYSLATGAEPSIMRAFLFILINETAKTLHRRQKPMRVFFAALTLQLTLNPSVAGSAGFQLSYAAMAGIHLIFPTLRDWYPKSDGRDPIRKIWDSMAMSISCQAATAPLAWLYFRSFPQYFLLTNLLALPLSSVLMTAGLCVIILSSAGLCPPFLVAINDKICSILIWILQTISSI